MNVNEIVEGLRAEFPGKDIVLIPPENPTEIICEVEPGNERSSAVAYISESKPHYHRESRETYIVQEGELSLHIAGRQYLLKEGESQTVSPGKVHSASADWARVSIDSVPGWSETDHILASRR